MIARVKSRTSRRRTPPKTGLTGSVRTYEALKALIISGALAPGSDLDESELVQRFEVSRTPVREALIRLSMEGLVTNLPNRGAKVSNLNFSDVTDHLEIMDILTPSVCYLAALRRTDADLEAIREQVDRLNATGREEVQKRVDAIFDLYTALGEATHNETLAHLYKLAIYAKLRIFRMSAERSETQEEWAAHIAELREVYLDLYSSIEAGNAPKAQSAARQWMNIIRERLSKALLSAPSRDVEVQLRG